MSRLIKSNLCLARVIVKEDTSPAIFYANRGPWINLEVKLEWLVDKIPNQIEPLYLSGAASPSTSRGEFLIRPSKPLLSFDEWTSVEVNPKFFSHFLGKPIEMILYCSSHTEPIVRWVNSWKSSKIIVKSRKKKIYSPRSKPNSKRRKLEDHQKDYAELLEFSKRCYLALTGLVVEDMITCLENVPKQVLVN